MLGVKTAIIGFILVCLIFPGIIKNKAQYYWALIAVLLGMLLQALATMFSFPVVLGEQGVQVGTLWRACNVIDAFLDIFAVILLVLASGGLTARQLAGDLARAYEVMRRGETEKTVIIPLPGQTPRQPDAEDEDEQKPRRYTIDDPTATNQPPPKKEDGGPIPLE
jgi:hypothetical protein